MNYGLLIFVVLCFQSSAIAQSNLTQDSPQNVSNQAEANATLLGQDLSISHVIEVIAAHTGVSTQTQLQFLGKLKTLLDASAQYDSTPDATLYVAGMRVWSGALTQSNGSYGYKGGIAPTKMAFPLVSYPVGPLILAIDAGVVFEAQMSAKLTPGLAYPVTDSNLKASLSASASGSAFLEGSAKLLILKAGVGGSIQVIDGTSSMDALLYFQSPPQLSYGGKVNLLQGHVYAFADSYKLFGSWRRFWSHDFYNWAGKCYSFGSASCAVN